MFLAVDSGANLSCLFPVSPLFILYIKSFCNIKQDTHTNGFALVFVTVSYKKEKGTKNK